MSSTANGDISKGRIWKVIGASAVGTMIEWYDFYIFGSLTTVIAPLFYPPENQTFAYIAYLATFAVGFVSDIRDRKSTRLNSSHPSISYAVFCLKKKTPHL